MARGKPDLQEMWSEGSEICKNMIRRKRDLQKHGLQEAKYAGSGFSTKQCLSELVSRRKQNLQETGSREMESAGTGIHAGTGFSKPQ